MISEGSYDTEHWSNDAEIFALITGINYILNIYSNKNQLFKIEKKNTIFLLLLYFGSNKCMSRKE